MRGGTHSILPDKGLLRDTRWVVGPTAYYPTKAFCVVPAVVVGPTAYYPTKAYWGPGFLTCNRPPGCSGAERFALQLTPSLRFNHRAAIEALDRPEAKGWQK